MIGFDINGQRLNELRQGVDCTNETSTEELQAAQLLEFTSDPEQLAVADVFVVTVPTPIDSAKRPDLRPLENASSAVGRALKARAAQGTSSTPVDLRKARSIPVLQKRHVCRSWSARAACASTQWSQEQAFAAGYSPERINPVTKSTGSQRSPRH